MNRLALFARVGAVLAAGCVGGLGPSNAGDSPTGATDAPGDQLPDLTLSLPDGPKERPERPAELNRSSVRAYVHDFQYRYAYNSLWFSEYTEVTLDCSVASVTERREGYNVTVSCTGYSNTGGSTENGTATELHADYFTQAFVYYIDQDSTLRTGDGGGPDGWHPTATPTAQPTLTGDSG